MNNKFLHICFIANIVLLACLLQISCLSESKNNKTNLQSLKAEEQRGSSALNKGKEKRHTASLQFSESKKKPNLARKQSKTVQYRFDDEIIPNDSPINNRMYSEFSSEEYAKIYAEAEWEPIRIYIDFSKLNSQTDEFPIETVKGLKKIMLQAKEVLEKLVKVKRLTKRLMPSPRTRINPHLSFSADVISEGAEADLLITVELDDSVSTNTLPAANTIELEKKSGRPIIGIIKYNSFYFDMENITSKADLGRAIHEFMHILAFNKHYFSKFIDPKTLQRIPKDKVVKESIVDEKPTKLMILPGVVKAARKHFNCNNLEGLELESQELDGTEFSHWKQRFMHGDVMTGEPAAENAISEMTLAVLDDSGWYQTNPYTGGLFVYGQNKGCAFLEEKCIVDGVTKFKNEFCVGPNESNCDSSHRHRTICPINDNDANLPTKYSYFSSPNVGGISKLANFCPIPRKNQDTMGNNDIRDSCIYGIDGEEEIYDEFRKYEIIGSNSACFVTHVINMYPTTSGLRSNKSFRSVCYEYSCNDNEGIVEVSLGLKSYRCPREGGPIEVDVKKSVKGILHCIDYNLICNQTVKCNNIHQCAIKESKRKDLKFDYIPKTIGSGSNFEQ